MSPPRATPTKPATKPAKKPATPRTPRRKKTDEPAVEPLAPVEPVEDFAPPAELAPEVVDEPTQPVDVFADDGLPAPEVQEEREFEDTGALLQVHGIDVFYGPIQALRGVSLSVDAGERIALVGANGAGKTTTLRAISGLLSPAKGHIVFDGERIDGLPANRVVERGVAHLPEGRELFFGLTVEENIRAGFWSKRKSDLSYKQRRDQVMDYFPILRERSKQAAGTLSGGEQQMLGVARALMSNPRLLIVDELSLGLAPKIVSQLFEILATINAQGTAVLIVEQFVHMALANTDRALVLAKGHVVLEGRSADLLADPKLIASYLGEEVAEDGHAGQTAH